MTTRGKCSADFEPATIQLSILGVEREVSLPVPRGESSPLELLPIAREISRQATGVALEAAASRGEHVPCRAGCAACCRHLVPLSSLEAVALADLIAALAPERRSVIRDRFAGAVRRMETEGILDPDAPKGRSSLCAQSRADESLWENASRRYFALRIPCPFLENENCSIYEHRPMSCREYHVTTPAELCAVWNSGAKETERPVRMSEELADVMSSLFDVHALLIPLPLLLEWAEVHGEKLRKTRAGEVMFRALLDQLGDDAPQP